MTDPVTEITRDDGELVGQVRCVGGDSWVPETIFGGVLGSATDHDAACAVVLNYGMSSLVEPWWIADSGSWVRVELVEIQAKRVRVRPWNPSNSAIGGHAGAGRWVSPSDNPLVLKEPIDRR